MQPFVGKLKAVIWDMDGVIVDSGPIHFASWHDTLRQYDLDVTTAQLRRMFGMTSPEVVRLLFGPQVDDAFVHTLCEEKERQFRESIRHTAAYLPGAEYWLKKFQQLGIHQALASSGSQENVDAVLDALNARSYLDFVVSGKNLPSKPDPSVFLCAVNKLGIPKENCLVIEDAIAGVAGAKNAGIKCLAVATTNQPAELHLADLVLETLDNLNIEALSLLFPD